MTIDVLGMNGPFPEGNGATSGYLLSEKDTHVCLDMGSGTLSRLTGLMPPEKLTALVFSHWHYDHTSDVLPFLYRLQATQTVLPVYGPSDEKSEIRRILKQEACISYQDILPGDTVQLGDIQIEVYSALHPVPGNMYRMKGSSVVCYTGDTNEQDNLEDFADHADILLADGLFTEALWGPGKPHLSAQKCAQLANRAGVRELIITHLHPFIDKHTLLNEARKEFPHVVLAECGAHYEVK